MSRFRMVSMELWENPIVMEEMTSDEKLFYLYLLTNLHTTQIGIYKIMKKQIAFETSLTMDSVQSLMKRFEEDYKLIRYNLETREIAIKNWGKDIHLRGGKPVMDCITSELKKVQDYSLIQYVSESIQKKEIRGLYEAFYHQLNRNKEDNEQVNKVTDDTFLCISTIRGQEKEKEKEKEYKKQQKELLPKIENNPELENHSKMNQVSKDVKDLIEFWDENGFGLTNMNAKQQLLSWLDDSRFLQPKEMILKAMNIACANNKRTLKYIVGILKNWENKSLLTVEEVDSHDAKQKSVLRKQSFTETMPTGRAIPSEFVLDLSAGEDE